ncbi:MAG: hypothetical protein AB7P12_11100 [Alphaproteobacteria bacterium]
MGKSVNDNHQNGNGSKNSSRLFFGDNLEILRSGAIPDSSVDLIYLDPPFNSKAQYNVLFQSPRADVASAQAGAFVDTWTWGEEAEASYKAVMEHGGGTAKLIDALRSALGTSDMMAYLVSQSLPENPSRRHLRCRRICERDHLEAYWRARQPHDGASAIGSVSLSMADSLAGPLLGSEVPSRPALAGSADLRPSESTRSASPACFAPHAAPCGGRGFAPVGAVGS